MKAHREPKKNLMQLPPQDALEGNGRGTQHIPTPVEMLHLGQWVSFVAHAHTSHSAFVNCGI